ncbi:hypothetical protein CY34DRAFT_101194 [Suillus luteus UH-Slu-Lm8-n1]|uniref:Unplaced genomic scaffold CY34scaffold_1059, whole genome shotgun sequence n=1 Tax=Suillus luteus UH-Slu-Lm8-n1 TaxID=930992 RepID=A0A0D0A305_9AGAM|nr:hypothetical protein CY34DRAFT_101194 [Suillus luteus UH-Slu-Lm8-n1]
MSQGITWGVEADTLPLKCAMPVFEGLFPEDHDLIVQSLLYRFAQWHALAKLRMHLDTTFSVFNTTFRRLSGWLPLSENSLALQQLKKVSQCLRVFM